MSRPSRIGSPLRIAAGDVVGVVERGVGDDDAADGDGGQARDGGERAGAADLDLDCLEPGDGALGGELVGDGPARRGGAEAEAGLEVEAVDLVDHAVDVVAEGGAAGLDVAVSGEHVVDAVAGRHQRIGGEAERRESGDRAGLGVRERLGDLAPGVGEEPQRTGGGDPGIELAQRSGGRVARVGEGPGAGLRLAGVEGGEIRVAHIDLAADLEHGGGAGQGLGDVVDGAGVGGDVLAGLAVAARGGLDEEAVLVAEREREAVDLGFGGVGERGVGGDAEKTPHAPVEFRHVWIGEGVAEAEHRDGVADLCERLRRGRANPVGGAVAAFEVGEARLDGGIAALEGVVFRVGDLGRVSLVIGEVRRVDLAREKGEFRLGLGGREVFDGTTVHLAARSGTLDASE